MGPVVDPFTSSEVLPARASVVIIGGGIIGASAALALAEKKVDVVLCEKGLIGGEQSSRNWGWVRKQGRDSREMPLIVESLRMWEKLNQIVGAETGFRQSGVLHVCNSDEEMHKREAWLDIARPYQLDTRLIGSGELSRLMPGTTRTFKGALYTPSDGRAEPQKATPAIAAAAVKAGAKIFANCSVRGVETAAGKVSAVITEKGRIACDSVLLAGGAWSRLLCKGSDLTLPQLRVRSTAQRTSPIEGGPETNAWMPDVAYRRRLDGGYTIASSESAIADIEPANFRFFSSFLPALRMEWNNLHISFGRRFFEAIAEGRSRPFENPSVFEDTRVLDPEPRTALNASAMRAICKVFPVFEKAQVVQEWAGIIDVTPDAVPVISGVGKIPGYYIATGFSGHGFGIGPAAGRLAADLVTGDTPIVDPRDFRFSRFADGTPILVEAGV